MLHGNKRNTLALLSRASDLSLETRLQDESSDSAAEDASKLELRPSQAKSLQDLLERSVLQYRALVELEHLSAANAPSSTLKAPPIVERLDEYPADGVDLTNLVTYPPKFQAVPVKPIFLDVAWNYIDYPGRPKKASSKALDGNGGNATPNPEPKKEAKKGWFGFGR